MECAQRGAKNVGASPAKKQRQMTRSYAAVVRSSGASPNASGCSTPSTKNCLPQPRRPRCPEARKPMIVVVSDEKTSSGSIKKQRLDKVRRQEFNEVVVAVGENRRVADGDVQPFLRKLDQALELEVKYRGAVQPSGSVSDGQQQPPLEANTITCGMRDGSAHVLRCLKVWYDLPSDVFFNAMSGIDRFLAKMKAQPKHLSCIAVSAFHLACRQYSLHQQEQLAESLIVSVPEPGDLVNISQSRCSPSDLLRMQTILQSKLEGNPAAGPDIPITALSFLRMMFGVSKAASQRLGLGNLFVDATTERPSLLLPDHLVHQLEILACDSLSLQFRPCEVSLALLATDFQLRATKHPGHSCALMGFVSELQKYCNISSESFISCLNVVMSLLDKYNGECTVAHRQRLVWKLSSRTLRHLRPTDKLRATLPTIKESSCVVRRTRSPSECSAMSIESLNMSSEDNSDEDDGLDACPKIGLVGCEEVHEEKEFSSADDQHLHCMEIEEESPSSVQWGNEE